MKARAAASSASDNQQMTVRLENRLLLAQTTAVRTHVRSYCDWRGGGVLGDTLGEKYRVAPIEHDATELRCDPVHWHKGSDEIVCVGEVDGTVGQLEDERSNKRVAREDRDLGVVLLSHRGLNQRAAVMRRQPRMAAAATLRTDGGGEKRGGRGPETGGKGGW